MTAAETAQRLGLSEAAVAAFSGTEAEFAQHFGVAKSEAPPPIIPIVAVTQPGTTGGTVAPAPPVSAKAKKK